MTQTVLAIDYGLARVGLAWGSREIGLVLGKTTLSNDATLMTELQQIIGREDVGQLVVGLPRGLDGQETEQTRLSRQFAERLQALGLPVQLIDEAGTSQLAKQRVSVTAPKEAIDAEAAAIILEDYLGQA